MNNSSREEIRAIMKNVRQKNRMPTSEIVVSETFERLGFTSDSIDPSNVLPNFNNMLRRLWEETLVTLEMYEEQTYAAGIAEEFINTYPVDVSESESIAKEKGFVSGIIHLFSRWYPNLRRAFQSVGQGRMARGGKDFELQIQGLFDLAKVPYEKQETTHHTDLILPNSALHQQNKTSAIVISVKRTLRERWAEVAEELFNLRTPNIFLFTADENITATHVETICGRYSIHLVVWDMIKEEKFSDRPLVLGYTEWAVERLAALRQFWPKD